MKYKEKVIVTIILSILLLNFSLISAKENVTTIKSNIVESDNYDIEFDISDMEYYPFIYSLKNKWEIDNIIGQSECEEGYLYSKDLNTNIIRKLINVKINHFTESKDLIYFAYNNNIYSVDYLGNNIEIVYSSKSELDSTNLLYHDNILFFTEHNILCALDLKNKKISYYNSSNTIDDIYVDSYNNIVLNSTEIISYNTYGELSLYSSNLISSLNNNIERSVVPSSEQLDNNLVEIFNDYPDGSYFTYSGGPCSHHGTGSCSYWGNCNCKAYCGTIQCVALAKYASDRYAHKSSWSPNSSDIIETDIQFTSQSAVIAFFSSIQTGAYIRLSYYSEAQQEQSGFHSMFFVKYDNNFITTYECNLNNNCNVKILKRTPSEFLSDYQNVWGIYRVSHDFSNGSSVSYNTQYHKIYCSRGCGAYIYEAHYCRNNLGSSTCESCGYTGVIEYTNKLELGNYE
ncbi:MAG: hypothetical protein ACI4WG_00180 [Erysipelotrichaceae bacterium]